MTEEWKWIKGYEGIYQISNHGRLKSFRESEGGYILSIKNKNGWYLTVNLFDGEGQRKTKRIHVLVAEAFIGEIPRGYQVHHKDGDKQNNTVGNLAIIHPSQHRKETEKVNPQITAGMVKYNQFQRPKRVRQYTSDGYFIAEYANAQIASELTGVCQRNILQVAHRTPFNSKGNIRKQAGGYVWMFAEEREVMRCEI